MLNKKVLVKSVTNLSEARYCAGMFIDFISFDFNPESEYFIPKTKFEEIKGWISGVKVLGTHNSANPDEISELISEYSLDGFLFSQNQLHLTPLVDAPIKILEWSLSDVSFLPDGLEAEILLLIKTSGEDFEKLPISNQILIGYDFENVKTDNEQVNGFAFMGSFEKQVGINPSTELMDALEYIEENF